MAVLSPTGATTGEFGVITGECRAPAVVPATMPVRGVAGKGEALRLLAAVGATGAAVVVCVVYVGLPLLVSTESLVSSPLDAVIVAGGVLLLAGGGVLRVLMATGFRASEGPGRHATGQSRRRPLDLKEQPRPGPKVRRDPRADRTVGQLPARLDSGTLYLRGVPDEVVRRLERLAVRDGVPVEVVAVRELAEASRRADNPLRLGSLPDLGVSAAALVRDLEAGRAGK